LSAYFVDTSALCKRYIAEVGTAWVQSQLEPSAGNLILISQLAILEMMTLLARRQRENSITTNAFVIHKNNFLLHADSEYLVIPVDDKAWLRARDLALKHPVRSLDAIQLASALEAAQALGAKPVFVSADERLLAVAAAEGFSVDNPNIHP